MRLLSPQENSQVGKAFLKLLAEDPLCRITQGTSKKWKTEDCSSPAWRPLLMQHVWESPLVPISLADGHTCWSLRACRGEADLATVVVFQCGHRLGRRWEIRSGDFGTSRSAFSCWLTRSLMETSHLSKLQSIICCCCSVAKSCLTLCDPMDCSLPLTISQSLPKFMSCSLWCNSSTAAYPE